MKARAQHKSLATPEGVYPFAALPLRLGFPSLADFEILSNVNGKPVAAAALREFPRISRVCRVSGQLLPYRCRHSRQLAPGVHVYDPRFCGLLRHACGPNAFLDMSELWLWALKDIQKGDWLTIDYAATEDKLLRQFACRCGSYNCRGWITGYDETPNADGQRFLQHWRRRSLG
jgi:hypothetical protein